MMTTSTSSPTEEAPVSKRKKVRMRDDGLVEDTVDEGVVMVEAEVQPPPSYKKALLEAFGSDGESESDWGEYFNEDLPENKWYKDDAEDNENGSNEKFTPGLEIGVSDDEITSWAKPWKNALIVKVLGMKVSFKLLEAKLRSYWVKEGSIHITDLADDFFLVKLSSIEDYRHALFEGPWKIADHYVVVQRFRPLFAASMIHKVAVWIRIPRLPTELCNDTFLKRVGAALGVMLKIDRLTSLHARVVVAAVEPAAAKTAVVSVAAAAAS